MPAPDMSIRLPQPAGSETVTGDRLTRKATGIIISAPEHDDPPGTIARYAWPVPRHRWFACGILATGKGAQLEARSLRFVPYPDDEDTPITSKLLRAVSLTAITEAAQAALTLTARTEQAVAAELRIAPRPAAEHLAGIRHGGQGRPPLHPALLRHTAEAYLAEAGDGPGLTDRLHDRLEELTGRTLTRAQVRWALRRAQADGWITPGERGRSARRIAGPRLIEARKQEQAA